MTTSKIRFGRTTFELNSETTSLLVSDNATTMTFDISKLADVSVKKTFTRIEPGSLRKKKIEDFIENIKVQMMVRGSKDPVSVTCFDKASDSRVDLSRQEQQFKNFINMLTASKHKSEIIIREDDYKLLIGFIKTGSVLSNLDAANVEALNKELQGATIVGKSDFPSNVIRLNSTVNLTDDKGRTIEVKIVMPGDADIKQKRISVFAPVGTALLGFKEGDRVKWLVPAGERTFRIEKVSNDKHVDMLTPVN